MVNAIESEKGVIGAGQQFSHAVLSPWGVDPGQLVSFLPGTAGMSSDRIAAVYGVRRGIERLRHGIAGLSTDLARADLRGTERVRIIALRADAIARQRELMSQYRELMSMARDPSSAFHRRLGRAAAQISRFANPILSWIGPGAAEAQTPERGFPWLDHRPDQPLGITGPKDAEDRLRRIREEIEKQREIRIPIRQPVSPEDLKKWREEARQKAKERGDPSMPLEETINANAPARQRVLTGVEPVTYTGPAGERIVRGQLIMPDPEERVARGQCPGAGGTCQDDQSKHHKVLKLPPTRLRLPNRCRIVACCFHMMDPSFRCHGRRSRMTEPPP
jgi:hypothetical protein